MDAAITALVDAINGSSLVEATALLMAAFLPLALPRASSATRHLLLALGLLAFLLLPMLAVVVPPWKVELAGIRPAANVLVEPPSAAPLVTAAPLRPVSRGLAAAVGTARSARPGPAAPTTVAPSLSATSLAPVLWGIWGVGAAALLLRLFEGRRRVALVASSARESHDPRLLGVLGRCTARIGVARPVTLRVGSRVEVPFVRGLLRPELVLPEEALDWPRGRVESVLMHELAHVLRFDELFLLAGRAAAALYWFHPLVWRAERRARRESERACDDMVLSRGTRPSEYAGHLLALAQALPAGGASTPVPAFAPAALDGSDGGELEGRIAAILSPTRARRPSSGAGMLGGALLLALLIAPLASLRLLAAPLPSKEKAHLTAYDRGMRAHRLGRYDEAIAAFLESVEKGERVADATYNIACGHAMKGEREEALQALALAIDRGFDDAEHMSYDDDLASLRGDARFLAEMDRAREAAHRAAVSRLESLRRDGETDPDVWAEVGTDLLQERELEPAIEALEHAAELDGDAPDGDAEEIAYNLACAHARAKHPDEALRWLQKAVEAGFDDFEHMAEDDDLASLRGDARFEAIVSSLREREGEEEMEEARQERAELEAEVAKRPDDGALWYELAMARYESGAQADAGEAFGRAADLHFREGTSAYNAACGYALAGRSEEAISWLSRAAGAGFDLDGADDDPDLASLRDHPRYRDLVDAARSRSTLGHKLI